MVALTPHDPRQDGITITVDRRQLVPVRVERDDDGTVAATMDVDAPTAIMVLIPVEGAIGRSAAAGDDEDLDAVVDEIVLEIGLGQETPAREPIGGGIGLRWVAILAACTAAGAIGLSAMAAGLAGAIGAVFGAALACGLLAPLLAAEGRRLGIVSQPQGVGR